MVITFSLCACTFGNENSLSHNNLTQDNKTPTSNPTADIGTLIVGGLFAGERWEYTYLYFYAGESLHHRQNENTKIRMNAFMNEVNQLGEEGWELVSSSTNGYENFSYTLFFKRKLT